MICISQIVCCYGYQVSMVNIRYFNNSFVLSRLHIWYRASWASKLLCLLMFHSGYHEDQVSIATRYVVHAHCFTKHGYQV